MLSKQKQKEILECFKYQIPLPGWGEEGQEAIAKAHVVIVGLGGLGSHSALSLARAGVGNFTLIDPDHVESTNLPRQHFTRKQVGKLKIDSIRDEIYKINPVIRQVDTYSWYLKYSWIEKLENVDIFIDGLDNWRARYLINDFCNKHGIPWVYAAVSGVRGNIYSILPKTEKGQTPWELEGISTLDLRELLGNEPMDNVGGKSNKSTPGVLSPLLPIIANLQIIEALKILIHNYKAVCKDFLTFNGWDMQWRPIKVKD